MPILIRLTELHWIIPTEKKFNRMVLGIGTIQTIDIKAVSMVVVKNTLNQIHAALAFCDSFRLS